MTPELPFLSEGERLPMDLDGLDLEGSPLGLDEYLGNHERTLLYFYPFDNREEPPAGWKLLAEHARDLEEKRIGVVGVTGPAVATREAGANLDRAPFPVLEDHDYRLGQALGILGGRTGDSVTRNAPPRGLVAVDASGQVLAARREDGAEDVRAVLENPF